MFLKEIFLKKRPENTNFFPFNIPLFKNFEKIKLNSNIVFFIGENGSGKSTLLEGIAANINLPVIGRTQIEYDLSMKKARYLGEHLGLSWKIRCRKGFFLRAEDVFNFTYKVKQDQDELEDLEKDYDKTLTGYGLQLAKGAVSGQRNQLIDKYGEDPDACSHGEFFINVFSKRLSENSIFLLDEPETPLSVSKQLILLSLIREYSKKGCQFIIATHSPILMAIPEAQILSFDSYPIKNIDYNNIEHVNITRDFLNNPDSFLRFL